MAKLSNTKGLSKVEKACINGMISEGYETSNIAKTLGRDEDMVIDYIASEIAKKTKEQTLPTSNKTQSGNKGVAVMTPEGSGRHEGRAKKSRAKDQSSYIHRI